MRRRVFFLVAISALSTLQLDAAWGSSQDVRAAGSSDSVKKVIVNNYYFDAYPYSIHRYYAYPLYRYYYPRVHFGFSAFAPIYRRGFDYRPSYFRGYGPGRHFGYLRGPGIRRGFGRFRY